MKMEYLKSKKYDQKFVLDNLMGPNTLKIAEEIANHLHLHEGMKILDLGCGKALTSIFLAKEFGVTVFATDLWISATENLKRIDQMGIEDKVFPIHAEARSMPYANDFFDAIVSFDSYHYFGTDENYMNYYLAPLVKQGGEIAIAVPGLTKEFENGVPDNLKPYWVEKENLTYHSEQWWRKLLERTNVVDIVESFDLECTAEAWEDWLRSSNPIAKGDIPFYRADINHELATIGIIVKRK
jgi:cyclopropane fatty-acyl-phospholipid synthase-like methyltransferase